MTFVTINSVMLCHVIYVTDHKNNTNNLTNRHEITTGQCYFIFFNFIVFSMAFMHTFRHYIRKAYVDDVSLHDT